MPRRRGWFRLRRESRRCGRLGRRALLLRLELLELLGQDLLLRAPAILVVREARAGRDQPADDHVLL